MAILRTDIISGLETPTAVTGAVEFDGNDYLSIGASGDFNFLHSGDNDWTAEFWFKTGTITRQPIFGTAGSSAQTGIYLQVMSQADGQTDRAGIYVSVNKSSAGNYRYWGANDCLKINTWHHVAVVWDSKGGGNGKRIFLYVDGKLTADGIGTAGGSFGAIDGYVASDHSYPLRIGYNQHSSSYLTGSVSNFRIVNGQRLYTSDFTPLDHGLELIPGTNIICCNNPDSVTASGTAGIGTNHLITANGNPAIDTDNPGLTRDFTHGTEFQGVTTFDTQGFLVVPSGSTEQRGAGRGMIAAQGNSIEYITISSTGNTKDFGDLSYAPNGYAGSCSSSTRGIVAGGYQPDTNHIDYVTIASQGDGKEFGDIAGHDNIYGMGGCGSNTRGILAGGFKSPTSNDGAEPQINYMTFASIGNSQDFGDLVQGVRYCGSCSSSTRGVWAGGRWSGSGNANWNILQYVTISTLGDAINFGDLNYSTGVYAKFGCSSDTRGVFGGGTTPTYQNEMSYITIASLGDSNDFGDLTQLRAHAASTSNKIRGVWAGGYNPSARNTIDYVTIASAGNAQDFGDCLSSKTAATGFSDSHGGLS
tara:strand:- start:1550 stop:3310 length:1761 start_codon:yes stop_codon:yes gene_type:complete